MGLYLFADDGEQVATDHLMMRYWDAEQCRFVVEPLPLADASAWEKDAMVVHHGTGGLRV